MDGGGERTLAETPTWAVAALLTSRNKKALHEALERVKAELMVLGFISLILTFGQNFIARICIPSSVANTMLPCKLNKMDDSSFSSSNDEHHRRLSWNVHRILTSSSAIPPCHAGYEPLISASGIHQLHILIFFLAVFHVIFSAVIMALGRLKIRGWKEWELETSSNDYLISNDPSRFRLTHQTSFIKAHNNFLTRSRFFFYMACFFRQFFRSVTKTDYITLRNGFITAHIAPGRSFDFRKYIKRSLEDDFQVVVGVSPVLWVSFVISLILNVHGWHMLFWASLIPLIIILAVGTKLQSVLAKMALETIERHAVVQGIPLVQASDEYFWFSRPRLMLHLIHFTLFQYIKLRYCFDDSLPFAVAKLAVGIFSLCLCSYITLPLYALVTQMGSYMKRSVFDEQTSEALKRWHNAAKEKQQAEGSGKSSVAEGSGKSSVAEGSRKSSVRSLYRSKTTGPPIRRFRYEGHRKTYSEAQGEETEMTLQIGEETASDDEITLLNFTS
ncbi:MLO-like protein [Drosera capensis]